MPDEVEPYFPTVRQLRHLQELTKTEAAFKAGMSDSAYARFEYLNGLRGDARINAKIGRVHIETIRRVAVAFNVPVASIMLPEYLIARIGPGPGFRVTTTALSIQCPHCHHELHRGRCTNHECPGKQGSTRD